ncbi:9046_t:CDS:2 [Funneliformis mosseae]|uniref:9046_t:CDS:1 n=1 Tax=Funneliformis mosseae TaxID=27381 RepID=A0A9N8V2P0_FUNMO|nr:9046_t:CDS:2 [Funneliformis mosseae]
MKKLSNNENDDIADKDSLTTRHLKFSVPVMFTGFERSIYNPKTEWACNSTKSGTFRSVIIFAVVVI